MTKHYKMWKILQAHFRPWTPARAAYGTKVTTSFGYTMSIFYYYVKTWNFYVSRHASLASILWHPRILYAGTERRPGWRVDCWNSYFEACSRFLVYRGRIYLVDPRSESNIDFTHGPHCWFRARRRVAPAHQRAAGELRLPTISHAIQTETRRQEM